MPPSSSPLRGLQSRTTARRRSVLSRSPVQMSTSASVDGLRERVALRAGERLRHERLRQARAARRAEQLVQVLRRSAATSTLPVRCTVGSPPPTVAALSVRTSLQPARGSRPRPLSVGPARPAPLPARRRELVEDRVGQRVGAALEAQVALLAVRHRAGLQARAARARVQREVELRRRALRRRCRTGREVERDGARDALQAARRRGSCAGRAARCAPASGPGRSGAGAPAASASSPPPPPPQAASGSDEEERRQRAAGGDGGGGTRARRA